MSPNELTFVAFVVSIFVIGGALRLIAERIERGRINRVLREHGERTTPHRRHRDM